MDTQYRAYMFSKKWAKKKLLLFQQRGKECEICGSIKHIHVHHLTYERVYNELLSDLQVVCSLCHSKIHGKDLTVRSFIQPKKKKKPLIKKKLNAKAKRKLALKKAIKAQEHKKNQTKWNIF